MIDKLKNAWKSVTIWFNGLLLAMLPFTDQVKEALPQISQYIDGNAFKYFAMGVMLLNIALRFKTNKGLHDK